MSFIEKLAGVLTYPLMSAVRINFLADVDVESVYKDDWPIESVKREVVEGNVWVNTGGTTAFVVQDRHTGKPRGIIVRDFTPKGKNKGFVSINEGFPKGESLIEEQKITTLGPNRPQRHIRGVGKFTWIREDE